MLNPVANAVKEIEMTIPRQILTEVFGREDYRDWRRVAPVSIDEMIKSKVIRPRVLKDCNLVGGRHVVISLDGLEGSVQDTYTIVYNIPPERTGNREIMSILSVSYMPIAGVMGTIGAPYDALNPISSSDAEMAGQRVMDSFANVPHVSTATAELIGYNTVMIRDQMRSTSVYTLRCMLANEEHLSNISPRSYKVLAKACKLAVKSYIYNTLIIRMDQGILEQGQALGVFKEIVDTYSEAEEEYQTYIREVLQKVLFMNDVMSYDRFIRLQVNPGL